MSDCHGGMLRPSAVPPVEGVWGFEDADGGLRIAVMLGPTELRSSSTAVTRSVEAVESRARGGELRSRLDTAVVRLELLPSYGSTAAPTGRRTPVTTQPTAAYAISPYVLIAAYEPCLDAAPPAIRYIRRDEQGHIAIDAMLWRARTE